MRLVFDFGGVLVRWRPAELIRRLLPEQGRDAVSAALWARRIFQSEGSGWLDFDRGAIDVGTLVARLAAHTGLDPRALRALVDAVPDELQPIAESVALLDALRGAGARLHFLSNMPAPYADELERRHAFVGWFSDGVYSSRVGCVKPEPEIYALAARRFGAAPAELVFVDDHAPNVDAARAAGWQALRFDGAASCEAALRAAGWWPQAGVGSGVARR